MKCSTFKKTNFVASYGAVNSIHNEHKCSNLWGEFLYGIVHFCMSKEVLGTISELVTFAALIIPTVPFTFKKIKCTGKAYGTVKCKGKAVGQIYFPAQFYGTVDLQHVRPSALCVGHNQLSF